MKCQISHKPKYDLQTGGLKCTICGTLLDDFGNEYLNYTKREMELAVDFGVLLYSENCNVGIGEVDRKLVEEAFKKMMERNDILSELKRARSR